MSIKILGGVARGITLSTPNNLIRPTSVLLKRRFFDSHQDLSGYYFIDLCAGSGAIGLEAFSRGAEKVYLNEINSKVFRYLKQNVQDFIKKISTEEIYITKLDFKKFLERHEFEDHGIIFFDPPYEEVQLYKDFHHFISDRKLKNKFIIEFCRQKTMPEDEMKSLFGEPERSYQQGTSFLYVYEIK